MSPVEMPEAYADDLRLSMERGGMTTMEKIEKFDGEFGFLSNFWPSAVMLSDSEFPDVYRTVEHAYQAAKTLDKKKRMVIREAETPGEAKRMGKKVALRPAWDDIKLNIMRDLLWQKFSENPDLRAKLLATEDTELIEGNTWGDIFWGVDLHTGKGENHLGKMLMETRDKIRANTAAVLYAKRVAPELDLFEDMLKRAKIPYTKCSEFESDVVAFSIDNAEEDGNSYVRFHRDGYLIEVKGYGYWY